MGSNNIGKIVPFPDIHPEQDTLEAEACDWFTRLDNGDLSPEDWTAFRKWVACSPQHRAEINRIANVWQELDILTELAVGRNKATGGKNRDRGARTRFSQFFSGPRLGIALVSVLVLIVATVSLFRLPGQTPVDPGWIYATDIGEQQTVTLADGGTVLLNTDSRMEVVYNNAYRVVRLLKGEAHFTVVHDPGRPFLVYAGRGIMRALGTAFTVRLRLRDVEVTVTEGTVELASAPETRAGKPQSAPESTAAPEPAARLAVIKAGHHATFNRDIESIQPLAVEELARELAWQKGMLSFSGDLLEFVVEEVSRYTPVKIVILDPALRDLRIGGYFRIGETEDIFEALETTFNVRVQRVGEKLVYLASASE